MVKRGWLWMILGGLLPLLAFFTQAHASTSLTSATYADPVPVHVFRAICIALAIAHVLVALGYDAIGARSFGGSAQAFAQLGALGLLVAAGCEVGSGVLARTPRHSDQIDQLTTGYAVAGALIAVGTFGAGLALVRRWTWVAVPLVASAVCLVAFTAPALAPPGLLYDVSISIPGPAVMVALNSWSPVYALLGLAMLTRPIRQ